MGILAVALEPDRAGGGPSLLVQSGRNPSGTDHESVENFTHTVLSSIINVPPLVFANTGSALAMARTRASKNTGAPL